MLNQRERLDELVEKLKEKRALNPISPQERAEKNKQLFEEYQKKLRELGIIYIDPMEEHR